MKFFKKKSSENSEKIWFSKLKSSMILSSSKIHNSIKNFFSKNITTEESLQNLEDTLIQSDLGFETTKNIIDDIKSNKFQKKSIQEIHSILEDKILQILKPIEKSLQINHLHKPHVILIVGVNGTGKTTTIGKLSKKLKNDGMSIMIVAGDRFRVSAIEQLSILGKRINVPVFSSNVIKDSASLVYESWKEAKERKIDVLIVDTAGRLHNKIELMDELAKIVRVIKKHDLSAPHDVIQILDATTGQNALNQVKIFREFSGVNGLIITKIDGTSKAGVIVSISSKYQIPVYFLGVGENINDLVTFSSKSFSNALIGI